MLGQTGCTDQQPKQRTRTWEFFYFIYCIGLHDKHFWPLYLVILYMTRHCPLPSIGKAYKGSWLWATPKNICNTNLVLALIAQSPSREVAHGNLLVIKRLKRFFSPRPIVFYCKNLGFIYLLLYY